jgi:hypothetical protein
MVGRQRKRTNPQNLIGKTQPRKILKVPTLEDSDYQDSDDDEPHYLMKKSRKSHTGFAIDPLAYKLVPKFKTKNI